MSHFILQRTFCYEIIVGRNSNEIPFKSTDEALTTTTVPYIIIRRPELLRTDGTAPGYDGLTKIYFILRWIESEI